MSKRTAETATELLKRCHSWMTFNLDVLPETPTTNELLADIENLVNGVNEPKGGL